MTQPDPQPAQPGHTRRDFLKNSAAAVGAAAAAGTLLTNVPAVHAAGNDTVKIGLIGCGGRGNGAAAQALSTSGQTKLVALADAFEDNARNALFGLKQQFNEKVDVPNDRVFSGFDAYQRVLDADPDVVVLATPPGFRPIHFEAAIKAGKNVFMEKPVATDAPGVRKVLAAAKMAKEKNLKVGVGLQRHHSKKYQETVKRLQDGALGDLQLLRVFWCDGGVWVRQRQPQQSEMEYQMRNWYYFNWLCGDHINEQHIHNLDVANWVKKGPPARARGQGGRQVRTGIDHGEIFDHHAVEYTYPDGTVMLSMCHHWPNAWRDVSEHAHGSKGYCNIGAGHMQFSQAAGGGEWRYQGPDPDHYQTEHDVLFDAIRNNKEHNEAEYGATSTMTAIMGRMATYSGLELTWEQALNSEVSLMPEKFDFKADPPTKPDENGRYPIPMPGVTKAF